MAFFGLYWLQRSNSNSLFRALISEGFALSIWSGYCKRFPRSFASNGLTNKPKSTRKYLFDSVQKLKEIAAPLGLFMLVWMILNLLYKMKKVRSIWKAVYVHLNTKVCYYSISNSISLLTWYAGFDYILWYWSWWGRIQSMKQFQRKQIMFLMHAIQTI